MKYVVRHVAGRWRVYLIFSAEMGGGSEEVAKLVDQEQAIVVRDALNAYVQRHPAVKRPNGKRSAEGGVNARGDTLESLHSGSVPAVRIIA